MSLLIQIEYQFCYARWPENPESKLNLLIWEDDRRKIPYYINWMTKL